MQSTAEPNTVVIADSTRKLLGNLFELAQLSLLAASGNDFGGVKA
jgi:hypothetical protein